MAWQMVRFRKTQIARQSLTVFPCRHESWRMPCANPKLPLLFITSALILWRPAATSGGTLVGHVRDLNWYARYQSNPAGVGYYEYAVNANASGSSGAGGYAATDVYGAFSMANLAAGVCTVASCMSTTNAVRPACFTASGLVRTTSSRTHSRNVMV